MLQKYYKGKFHRFQLKFCVPYRFFDDAAIRNANEKIAGISENGSGRGLLLHPSPGLALNSCGSAAGAFAARKAQIEIERYLGREPESPIRMLRAQNY